MAVTREDTEFLHALGKALLALAASAAILFVIFLIYTTTVSQVGANTGHNKTILGKQLTTRMGTTQIVGDAIEVTGFKAHNDENHALATLRTTFSASNYPLLSYQFDGWHAGMRVNFIWRTADNPRKLSTTPLQWNPGKPSTFNLTNLVNWQGTITEVGVHVLGELRGQPLTISRLVLEPLSWQGMVAAVWSEWTAFRGWTGRSINFLRGTPDISTISPTLAAATWAGIAIVFLFIPGALKRKHNLNSYGAVILIPWIAVDLLWQSELTTQLKETEYLFDEKTTHEKHLADLDRHIYSYTMRLKKDVLPLSGSNIFILHDSDGHNYERLKTQYYLLPNNVYNYGRIPPSDSVKPGDYILILGDVPGLQFQQQESRLAWGGNNWLTVNLADSDPRGNLYKVVSESESSPKPEDNRADTGG